MKQLIYGFKYEMEGDKNPINLKLNAIIDKATQINPNDRYESVHALRKEIEGLLSYKVNLPKWLPYAAAACSLLLFFMFNPFNHLPSNQIDKTSASTIQLNESQRGIKPAGAAIPADVDISKNKYYALLIGNNDYSYWKKLHYPVTDVENMRHVLLDNYTFEKENITTVENGTYEKIYKAFESFTASGPNTYLLIYYAGHGKYDQVTEKAALIPVDAEEDSDSKNLTSDIIKDLLKKCKIHNILFISDACYLGAMASRGENKDTIEKPDINSFKSFVSKQSRKFISSGARESVPDKSYFNEYLIKYLKNNPHDITFEYTLYNDIIGPIQNNSLTTPVYGVFFDTKDEGGHFFFMKRK